MLVISLTVIPQRINNNFLKVLESLRTQPNIKEKLISVYVQMDSLPQILSDYEKRHKGEVEFTLVSDKYRSYSKFYYASKKYNKDCDIVTVDDDLVYKPVLYKNYDYYLNNTNMDGIVGGCCLFVPYDKNTYVITRPYKHNSNSKWLTESHNEHVRSLSGCFLIIPRGFFNDTDLNDIDEFIKTPVGTSDEDYLWYKGIIKNKYQYCSGLYPNGFGDVYNLALRYSYSLWENYNKYSSFHLEQIKFLNLQILNHIK